MKAVTFVEGSMIY